MNNSIDAGKVLALIKLMSDKQKFGKKPIGLDSISLALKITPNELMPLIEELKMDRAIVVHPNTSRSTRGVRKPATISLI